MLTNGNYFFTAIFALESFIKLASMSPRYFFAVRRAIFFNIACMVYIINRLGSKFNLVVTAAVAQL